MKKTSTLLLLLTITFFANSQKIYVKCDDPKPKGSIEKKVSELGYIVIKDSTKADAIVLFSYRKIKSTMSMSFKMKPNILAKIYIYDSKHILVDSTEEVGGLTAAWAGYNPRVEAAWKILSRDFQLVLNRSISLNKKEDTYSETNISKADELTKLKKLLDDGVLTKEEFEAEKKKILDK